MTSGMESEMEQLREEVRRLRESVARLTPPLEALLKMRSYHVYKRESVDLPLLPDERHIEEYCRLLRHYSFRLFLRDVIKNHEGFTTDDVTRYAARDVTEQYVAALEKMGLVQKAGERYRLSRGPVRSFGPTLEWFVARIFEREFRTEAIWGVRFRRANVGGDYDVIAKFNGDIIYVEVKSSPPRQIYQNEISAFMNRVDDLSPEIAVFLMDTELRMKDKIVPMFEEELSARGVSKRVERMEKELFHISDRIFIINSRGGIEGNIEKVMRWHLLHSQ